MGDTGEIAIVIEPRSLRLSGEALNSTESSVLTNGIKLRESDDDYSCLLVLPLHKNKNEGANGVRSHLL